MNQKISFALKYLFISAVLFQFVQAQVYAQGNPGRPGGGQMNIGRFYGRVIDEDGKGVGYAAVSLYRMQFDSATQTRQEVLVNGQITDEHGDFSLENLPIRGQFTLKISFLGYTEISKQVSFETEGSNGQGRPGNNQGRPGGGFNADKYDVDLGNINLLQEASNLDQVTVTAEATGVQLALDRKIYRVDKDNTSAGGTAIEALKNVPSLAVDLDGNLSLRNGSPQLFVDGRPTTLSLDQIAADAIETVEVITNPSAKFDASGGQSGIVNIVLKKDKRLGYNGSVRLGVDSRGGKNLGGNLNVGEGKVNAFLNAFYNERKGDSYNNSIRENLFGSPLTKVYQDGYGKQKGFFGNLRAGLDWFMDNRNTITFQGSMTRGQFGRPETLNVRTDSLYSSGITFSEYTRINDGERNFRNAGASVLFKHLYPKKGKELTADINYNNILFESNNEYTTDYFNRDVSFRERQDGSGGTQIVTLQTDYVNPLSEKIKLETGAYASIRKVDNDNFNYVFDPSINVWDRIMNFNDQYAYNDQVLAGYVTISHQFPKWGYQVGLRGESSNYEGSLAGESTFSNNYPLSLFPSIFITRKLNEEDNLQFSLTRRINRPNFFQLIPFTDYSDSLNLRRGNPDLIPEFTSSAEVSYQNIFKNGHNILITGYYKRARDLITNYQFTEGEGAGEVVISTFANSNSSEAYGVEFTVRNQVSKGIDLTSNINLYNSKVDASNVEAGLVNEQFTWFIKENMNIKLPAGITLQVSGQYQSKTAFSPNQGSGRFRGHYGSSNSAQGYSTPYWYVDAALRKDILKRKGSITLGMDDIFRSRIQGSYSESTLFVQENERWRNFQVVRLNFSYRFGKTDTSLFKRKNMNVNDNGSDMMGN
ncbi:MAG: TonB-dependent receptor [Saprospiraceae bacterium]|nr:TonB-dependent receptor [Saprospiraceae bacterium]